MGGLFLVGVVFHLLVHGRGLPSSPSPSQMLPKITLGIPGTERKASVVAKFTPIRAVEILAPNFESSTNPRTLSIVEYVAHCPVATSRKQYPPNQSIGAIICDNLREMAIVEGT